MNYLKQIIAFEDKQQVSGELSAGQQTLWYSLMYLNNKTGWLDTFTVANSTLESLTGLTRQGIYKARNILQQKGFINVKTNGKKASSYQVCKLYDINSLQDSSQVVDKGVGKQFASQDTDSLPIGRTLFKQNKTKPNETNKKNNKKAAGKKCQLESDFEKLWELYPKKQGKVNALKDYQKAIQDGVTNKEIQKGIVAYVNKIKADGIEPQFIKMGSTFFHQRSWEDDFTPDSTNPEGSSEYDDLY